MRYLDRALGIIRRFSEKKNHRGFTLMEAMLVIAIIAILASIVISAVNPARMLAQTRNVQRHTDIRELLGAITMFTINNDGYIPPNTAIPLVFGPTTFSGSHIIATGFDDSEGVAAFDMDADGDMDVIGISEDDGVRWWARSGSAPDFTWTEYVVDGSFEGEEELVIGDIDGDGKPDIVAVSEDDDQVAWWRNEGGSPLSFGSRIDIDPDHNEARVVEVADMDGDGDLDVIVGSDPPSRNVRWYRNNGNPTSGNWEYKDIESNFGHVHGIDVADLDGDGDMDVLAASKNKKDVTWWVNDGNPWQNNWDSYDIDSSFHGADDVFATDIDGDSDMDVVAIGSNGVSWWENNGTPESDGWTENVVTTSIGGDVLIGADFDGDGDTDLIGASSGGDKLAWWENAWPQPFSDTSIIASGDDVDDIESIAVADIDGDGDMDIVASIENNETIIWWENTSIAGYSAPASLAEVEGEYKSVCMQGIGVTECDSNNGVSLSVLAPTYIADIPSDPSGSGSVLTGYDVKYESGTNKIHVRASLAELGETIDLLGTIGVSNCLIWDIVSGEHTCVLFE